MESAKKIGLSSVLNSRIASQINIAVVKAFIEIRRYITKPIRKKLDDLEKVLMLHIDDTSRNFADHAAIINEIITRLNNLIETRQNQKGKLVLILINSGWLLKSLFRARQSDSRHAR